LVVNLAAKNAETIGEKDVSTNLTLRPLREFALTFVVNFPRQRPRQNNTKAGHPAFLISIHSFNFKLSL